MLKCFDLTEKDITFIHELKAATGAGSGREVIRRALEEYHKKILPKKSASEEITPPTPK